MPYVDSGWTGTATAGVREFEGSYGSCYVSTPVETVITTGGAQVKALGTTTAGLLKGFSHANNRLTYLSDQTATFQVQVAAVVICAGDGKTLGLSVAKNGTEIAATKSDLALASGAVPTSMNTCGLVSLTQGQYVEVFLANDTDTDNATINLMQFSVTEVG